MSTPFWQVWLGQTTNSNPQGSGSDASVNSNVLKQTYINRFLDVSGTFTVRYDASINGNLYLGPNSRLGLGLTAPAFILDQSGTARMQSPNSASYTSSPHTNQGNHGLVLTSTKASPGTAYSMGLGIDFSSGAGYITTGFINSSGTSTAQPLILNATGGDVGIGYKNPTAGLFVVGNQTVTGSATLGTYDAPAFYGNTVASFLNSVTPVGGGVSNAATIELGALNRDILTSFASNIVYKYALTTSVNNTSGCDFEIKGITTGTNAGLDGTAVRRLYISTTNTAIGNNAGTTTTTGTNNTFIGAGANTNNATASNSTAIGYNATTTASNQIVLGTNTESVAIPGSLTLKATQPIKGMVAGVAGAGGAGGTINFNYTFANVPVVVCTINTTSSIQLFSVGVSSITTTGFNFIRMQQQVNTTSGGGGAGESFNWIAIGT